MTSINHIDTGLVCLTMMSQVHGLSVSAERLKNEYGLSGMALGIAEIMLAAKGLGLKARRIQSAPDRLANIHYPAIAVLSDAGELESTGQSRFVIVGKVSSHKVLLQDPVKAEPVEMTRDDFLEAWTGDMILITRRSGQETRHRKFGISWFIPVLYKYRRLIGEVMLASLFVQLFALVTPLFFQVVIDKVLVHHGVNTLDVLMVGLLLIYCFEVVLSGLRTYVFSHTTNRVDVILGARLFRHLMTLPLAYFEARRVGDTVARVRELEGIRGFLTGKALMSTLDILFVFVFLSVMFYYSPLLTGIVIGTIPMYAILSMITTPVLRRYLNDKFNRGADNQAFLVETITGMETVKAGSLEGQSQKRWEEQLASYVAASFRATNMSNVIAQGASFINKLMILLILWLGAHLVMDGQLSVGMLVAFNMLAARVSGPALNIVSLWQEFQQAGISIKRLGDILNTPGETSYAPSRNSLPSINGQIVFDHVGFRYRPDSPDVLRDINLEIQPGQVIGIVGPSGSGKSTLAKMVQRFYIPQTGRVKIDGVDLALVDTSWLRRNTGVVLQDTFLFNRTIRENIALTNPSVSMEAVIQAAKMAGAHEFILQLPDAYDTQLDERGGNLSGGQRQRIAIARALIANPRILILDEATSALDYESERILANNMRYIAKGRTVLIIAHRLSAVRHADRIVVMEDGSISETGTHGQLLQKQGEYAQLWNLQMA